MNKSSGYRIICFIGIDGSGKTTLAESLFNELKSRGLPCRFCYGRYVPLISRPLVTMGKYLFLHDEDISDNVSYSSKKRASTNNHKLLTKLYNSLILFDYYLQSFFKVIIPLKRGAIVVCDRYVYDTVINDLIRTTNDFHDAYVMAENCFKMIPRPDLIFYVRVPEDIAYSRKNDTPSLEYLTERSSIYEYLQTQHKMIILDGTKCIAELHTEILKEALK